MLPRSFFDGIELGRLAIFLYPLLVPKAKNHPKTHKKENNQPHQPTD